MIESTDRNRFSMQPRMIPPMGGMRPQFDMFESQMNQPTQVAPSPDAPAQPEMRSVLKGSSEENIRRLLEQMKGSPQMRGFDRMRMRPQ